VGNPSGRFGGQSIRQVWWAIHPAGLASKLSTEKASDILIGLVSNLSAGLASKLSTGL
jgi:hypothetical protein